MLRLHKFIKLVQNEIIKLIRKRGTLIMTVLFVAVVIGFTGLCKVIAVSNSDYDWQQESFRWSEVAGNVEYYREQYERSIVAAEDGSILSCDMESKQEYEYWKFLEDREVRYDDWLYTEGLYSEYCADKFALENGTAGELAQAYSARIVQLESYMAENGWRLYYQEKIAELLAGGEGTDREAQLWFYQYALEKDIAPGTDEINTLLESVLQSKASLAELTARKEAGDMVPDVTIDALKDDITLGIYRLENGIARDISSDVRNSSLFELSEFSFWSVFAVCKTLIKLVGVMCIVIAGSIVAEEFSQGTYKFLLMSPAKRWKILCRQICHGASFWNRDAGGALLALTIVLYDLFRDGRARAAYALHTERHRCDELAFGLDYGRLSALDRRDLGNDDACACNFDAYQGECARYQRVAARIFLRIADRNASAQLRRRFRQISAVCQS